MSRLKNWRHTCRTPTRIVFRVGEEAVTVLVTPGATTAVSVLAAAPVRIVHSTYKEATDGYAQEDPARRPQADGPRPDAPPGE